MRKFRRLPALVFLLGALALPRIVVAQTVAGASGIFVLAPSDQPLPPVVYAAPFIAGGAIRVSWALMEPAEGVFNWSFIDGESATAAAAGKKISIYLGAGSKGTPAWVQDSLPIPAFRYIDENPYHPTYLDTVSLPVPWDSLYLAKLIAFLQAFGAHCASDTNIAYVRGASCMVTEGWGLANSDAFGQTWAAYGYTPDTLLYAYRQVLDSYMAAFPNTPEWVEVGNINFEPFISGLPKTYVGEHMAGYGFNTYPGRFNVWREDFSDCIPDPPPGNSFWHILYDHPCGNGAQAIWNVQDGVNCHFRMRPCDTTGMVCGKDTVLWLAVQRCLDYGMTYLEIYKADVMDTTLATTLQQTEDALLAQRQACLVSTLVTENVHSAIGIIVAPDPFTTEAIITSDVPLNDATATLYNALGMLVQVPMQLSGSSFVLHRDGLPIGLYMLRIAQRNGAVVTERVAITDGP